jgi:DNA-binding MarR family transcriptional regulator
VKNFTPKKSKCPAGLKTTQFFLLASIHRNVGESFTMGELAEVMVRDRSTVSSE